MAERFVLSNFGVRYFMYTDDEYVFNTEGNSLSSTAGEEIESVLSCDIGGLTKENTKYRTLNSDGWESVAVLGNTAEDGTFECLREGQGTTYTGTQDTFSKIKKWFLEATSSAGKAASRVIVEVVPRGTSGSNNVYEATAYHVIPNTWTPGTKDTETGQEYSFTVTPFDKPEILSVEESEEENKTTFTFTKQA